MRPETNRKVVLARRPEGMPALECFRLEEETLREPGEGEVLVATEHLSIDAFIRTILEEKSYHPSVPIGETITAFAVGRILESRSPEFAAGDGVCGPLGAQAHAIAPGFLLRKLDDTRAPLTAYLGLLGVTTGLTAYFGIREVGQVREGDTVVVSAAAGAVGSVAGQIAAIDGGRVIGIAGGAEKRRYLEEDLGLHAGIDYKGEDVGARLDELAPDGIDVYFDNVGGALLDVVLDRIRTRARVVICGAVSQYQHMESVRGPSLYLRLAERNARMQGFTVDHFQDRFPEAEAQLARWLAEGRIRLKEHVEKGLEAFPKALLMLFEGGHTGKLLVEV